MYRPGLLMTIQYCGFCLNQAKGTSEDNRVCVEALLDQTFLGQRLSSSSVGTLEGIQSACATAADEMPAPSERGVPMRLAHCWIVFSGMMMPSEHVQ